MSALTQNQINTMDDLATCYHCEVLMPPVMGSNNIFLHLENDTHRYTLGTDLISAGFIIVLRRKDNKLFYEILGVDYHE